MAVRSPRPEAGPLSIVQNPPISIARVACYKAMGWKQYSRMLGLSRGYPYILYLKRLTAGMPGRTRLLPLRCLPISRSAVFFGGADDPAQAPSAVPDVTDVPTDSNGTC